MGKSGVREAEDRVKALISRLRARDEEANRLLVGLKEISEPSDKLIEVLVKRRLYSGGSTDAKQVKKELLLRISASMGMLREFTPEELSAFLDKLEHNLLLGPPKKDDSTGRADKRSNETAGNRDARSEPLEMSLDTAKLKGAIEALSKQERDLLQSWASGTGDPDAAKKLESVQKKLLKIPGLKI